MVALPKQHNILDFPEQRQVNNEWYTQSEYIEAAREVMGGNIDLDPASCAMANQTVRATRYYTKEDDGLQQTWTIDGHPSRIWLNPPFGRIPNAPPEQRSTVAKWVKKALYHYQLGHVSQAVLLLPIHASVSWFLPLLDYPVCFTHRVWFYVPGGSPKRPRNKEKDTHRQGTVFVYLGPNEQKFIDTFSQFGRIARAIDTPKPSPVNLTLWNGGDA